MSSANNDSKIVRGIIVIVLLSVYLSSRRKNTIKNTVQIIADSYSKTLRDSVLTSGIITSPEVSRSKSTDMVKIVQIGGIIVAVMVLIGFIINETLGRGVW
jgi:hypothetical protein